MRKYICSVFLLCSLATYANRLTEEQAHDIACRFFSSSSLTYKSKKYSTTPQISLAFKTGSKESPLYLYNKEGNNGYVLIAGDDVIENPVIGWSDKGNIAEKNIPLGLSNLLQDYQKQMDYLRTHPESARKVAATSANDAQIVVAPLLKTQWNQASPYNKMLPEEFQVAGCVPTAMAQVMNYWQWPKQGRGKHTNRTYPDNWAQLLSEGKYDELKAGRVIATIDFSESAYDWDNMIASYRGEYTSKQTDAVAKLMLDCNTAADAQRLDTYGFSVGANAIDAVNAMVRYFSYSPNWQEIVGNQDSLIMHELDNKRPVLFAGYPSSSPGSYNSFNGHCFVCDGYDDAGYFHFNFGWGGTADGYFLTSLINPYNDNYGDVCYAYIGIQPSKTSFEKDGIYYDLLDSKRACVVYGNTSDANIQSTVNFEGKDYTVTKISNGAFRNTDVDINIVSLPATIDTIGSSAFYFAKVNTIDLGSVEMWNNVYFADRYANPQNSSINSYLLNGQPITNLVIPATVGKVRPHLFQHNEALQNLTFENGITEIGDSAFFGCYNLEYVELPHTAVAIGKAAFSNGVNHSKLETIGALNMAISIGDNAFAGCPVKNITLNDELTYVGNSAFSHHKTEYIDLPSKLERIGRQAFYSDNLYGFRDNEKKNMSYSIHNDALYNKEGTRLLQVPTWVRNSSGYGKRYEFGILKTARAISSEAFMGCTGIRKVIIPASVVDIEKGAFYYLENLTDFTNYSTTPQTIEEGTFSDVPFEYTDVSRKAKLHVLEGCGEAYASAPYWNRFNIIEDLPAGSTPAPGYDGEMNANGFILTYRVPEVGIQELRCLFSDNPVLTTDDNGLIVTTDKLKISIMWNSEDCLLEELVFTELEAPYDPTTQIKEITSDKKPFFIFSGNTIRIFGQKENTFVCLYSLDGRQLLSTKAAENGEAQITLPDNGQKTYILRVGNQSINIQKR